MSIQLALPKSASIKQLIVFQLALTKMTWKLRLFKLRHGIKTPKREIKTARREEGDFIILSAQTQYYTDEVVTDVMRGYAKKMYEELTERLKRIGGKLEARVFELYDHDIS